MFALIMKCNGGNWAATALFWIYFGVGVQAAAIANISHRISGKYQMVCSAILTCLIAYARNKLAGFDLVGVGSVSMDAALGFAFWAISFVIGNEKKYHLAWIFAGCAAICHIHEGIFCCIVIFCVAVADCVSKQRILLKENICILAAAAAMILVTLPNMITDKMDISNELFVYIYANVRHPHHLVPTSWGLDAIVKSGWVNIFVFLISLEIFFLLKNENIKRYLLEAVLLETTWFGALIFAYVFTERVPLAFVAAMFLSKMFKYVAFISLIMLLMAFVEARGHRLYLSGYLLLFFSFMTSILDMEQMAILYFFTAAVIMIETSTDIMKSRINAQMIAVFDGVFFFLFLSERVFPEGKSQIIAVMMIYLAVATIYFVGIKNKKAVGVISLAVCGCLIVFSIYGRIISFSDGALKMVSGEEVLVESAGEELYELAVEFKKNTDKNEQFIADPDDTEGSGWFQVISERNCYVIYKVIPSAKSAIDDWYERYLLTQDIMDKELPEVEQIMLEGNANYLLVKADYFEKFDQAENMSVFLESSQKAFRVYRLNRAI